MTTTALVLALACTVGVSAAAAQKVGLEANAGWVSEYIFRGIPQAKSSASAGLDLTSGILSLGTWAADVLDGNEVDVYGSGAFESGKVSGSVGATGYFYTGDFDNTYLEGNAEVTYGPVTASFAYGTHDVSPSVNYWFLGLSATHKDFTLTAGHFDYDDDPASSGNFAMLGYDFSLGEYLDMNISWVVSDDVLSGFGRTDHTIVLGLSKTFTIR
jgi:hypothetical protein